MPALNPFILKGRLSACSEEVIKLTSLSPERNVFLTLKESWWARQSRDAAPSITSHRGRGCPAVAQRGRSPLLMGRALAPAAPSSHSFTHLLGWLFLSSQGPKFDVQWNFSQCKTWCVCPLIIQTDGFILDFYFFQYKISLFLSTARGREGFGVNNVLCISCHLNECVTFHFDLQLHLQVTYLPH